MNFAAAIKTQSGILYYTGRAGEHYLSPNANDAFFGYSEEGAKRKAQQLCATRRNDHTTEAIAMANEQVLATSCHVSVE